MNKSAIRDAVAERMDVVLDRAAGRTNVSITSDAFLSNHITECDRRIMYRVYREEETEKRDDAGDFAKDAVVKSWVRLLNEKSSVKVLDTACLLDDARYSISGKADAVVSFQGVSAVLRLVPVCSEIEEIKKKGAKRRHTVDLMLLSWMADIHHGFLIYVDTYVGTHCTYHVVPLRPIVRSACEKCKRLNDIKLGGGLPDRVYETKNSKECQSCEYSATCWR